jgi:hypothetical protein
MTFLALILIVAHGFLAGVPATKDPNRAAIRVAASSTRCLSGDRWQTTLRLSTNLEHGTWSVRRPVTARWQPNVTQPVRRPFVQVVRTDANVLVETLSVTLIVNGTEKVRYADVIVQRPDC